MIQPIPAAVFGVTQGWLVGGWYSATPGQSCQNSTLAKYSRSRNETTPDTILSRSGVLRQSVTIFSCQVQFAFQCPGLAWSCSGPAARVTTGADWVTLGDAGIPGYYGVCWGTLGYTKVHWGTLRFSTTEVTPATAAYQVSLTTAPCMGCMAYHLNTTYHQNTILYHLYGFPLAPQHHHPVNWAWPKN